MTEKVDLLRRARVAALVASTVPTAATPTRAEVANAIKASICMHHGALGCAAEMGAAYGRSPETTVLRIRWARVTVAVAYAIPSRSAQLPPKG